MGGRGQFGRGESRWRVVVYSSANWRKRERGTVLYSTVVLVRYCTGTSTRTFPFPSCRKANCDSQRLCMPSLAARPVPPTSPSASFSLHYLIPPPLPFLSFFLQPRPPTQIIASSLLNCPTLLVTPMCASRPSQPTYKTVVTRAPSRWQPMTW